MAKFKELDPVRVTIDGQTFTGRIENVFFQRNSYVVNIDGFINHEIIATEDELELIPN